MNENKNIENVTEKNNKKSGPPILYVIVLIVFAIIMIASIYFGTISPIISAIHDIGIIMVVLRAFGAVGSFFMVRCILSYTKLFWRKRKRICCFSGFIFINYILYDLYGVFVLKIQLH